MANFKNSLYYLVTDKRTVPANANATGTIKTVGTAVIGTNTLFKTEMPIGSWLVDESQDEIRQITRVESDTLAYFGNAFTSDISLGTTPSVIHSKDAKPVSIAVSIPASANDGEVDGATFTKGSSLSFSKDSTGRSDARSLVNPIIVDGTGTTIQVLIQY